MRFVVCVGVVLLLAVVGAEKCVEENEVCDQTDYQSYVDCMRKRTKRDVNCNDDCGDSCNDGCDSCDCDECGGGGCDSRCESCCVSTASCTTRSCCHQQCHSQCRTSSCRRSCKKDCSTNISGGSAGSSASSSSSNTKNDVQSKIEAKHNITTIINLHNVINNTNIVDIPVNINNTNINNITIEAEAPSNGQTILIDREKLIQSAQKESTSTSTNCCKIIGPRQCTQTNEYPYAKCFHYRKQHCGDICKTSIMHAEPHQVCDQLSTGAQSCHQQIAYIPQPKPSCSYTSSWPYVSCGIMKQNCEGCYGHVINGGAPPKNCASNCYDDGFNMGPLYRQGPVFQPAYSPVPPCAYTGMCGQNGYQPQIYPQPYQPMMNPVDANYQVELLPGNGPYVSGTNNQIVNENDIRPGYNPYPGGAKKREAEKNE